MILRALCLLSCATLVACSSGGFDVSQAVDQDTGTTATDGATETGGSGDAATDTYVDPCADEAGVSKFCVDVALERPEHPPYDATSGAASLDIDGKGIVYVALYDKDPSGDAVTPKTVLQYPPPERVGEEADVDKDLPVTLNGHAPAGDYWVIAAFTDNKTAKRGTGDMSTLPGDFVLVPGINKDTNKAVYPKMTVTVGKTGRLTAKLRPYRLVDVDLGTTLKVHEQAQMNTSIHGDGPLAFIVYDGDLASTPTLLSATRGACVEMKPAAIAPPRVHANMGTVIEGMHNLLVVLFDYGPGTSKSDPWGQGSFLTATDKTVAPIPTVNISATSWTSSAKADFTDVFYPYDPGAKTDTLTCK